jgi:hypothetical protein
MAGESVLPVQECPDLVTHYVSCIPQGDGSGNMSNDQVVFYCERDTVLDAAFIRAEEGDADASYQLKACASATAAGSGTAMTDALVALVSATTKTWTITETANICPAGSSICLDVATAASTAFRCNVTLRVRTRVK